MNGLGGLPNYEHILPGTRLLIHGKDCLVIDHNKMFQAVKEVVIIKAKRYKVHTDSTNSEVTCRDSKSTTY